MTLKNLIDIIFEEEDTGGGFAAGLYRNCFNNDEIVTKFCNDYINFRLNNYKLYKANNAELFNYDSFDSFYNEVINWFKTNHPELLKGDKVKSFTSTIKNVSLNYYNKINQVS